MLHARGRRKEVPTSATYLVHGSAVAEDEVDRPFDVAILEVVTPRVVAQGVLGTVETAAVEVRLVPRDAEGSGLPSFHAWHWCRS